MKKFALGVVVGAALGHIVYEYAPEIERGVLGPNPKKWLSSTSVLQQINFVAF